MSDQSTSPALTPVAVLGTGKVGRLVCSLLARSGDYAVTAVDADIEQARLAVLGSDGARLPYARPAAADFEDRNDLARVIKGQRYVLSCAPYRCNVAIAETARAQGASYLDLTEDVEVTKAVKALSQGSESAFIPQCGLAPGFVSIAANWLASSFDRLDAVRLRVGALPRYPTNRLKYNLTWSTDGLINEYGNLCEAVVEGQPVNLPPLANLEHFNFEGEEYEAFNTSGGLGTLADSWAGQVRNLDYKTIRYPGHRDMMALLMQDLGFNQDRETFKTILERSVPYTEQDVVLVFVTVLGWRDGRHIQRSYAKKIYDGEIDGQHWGAIQITTASGICAVLDLHATGAFEGKGFLRQEDIPFGQFIANRFGRAFA
jgi:saccharopine dehydrogenase-like NADP-dependent oxidoreductase